MIRKADEKDFPQILEILQEIQKAGDSYFFENMIDEELLDYWIKPNFDCFVFEENGVIFGSYILGAIAQGRFSHTANASYIVAAATRGKGDRKSTRLNSSH